MAYRRTPRMQKRVDQRRREILEAAEALIAEKGFLATTMNDVAARAKTSIGNVYFYFSNKDEIVLAVIDSLCEEIWQVDELSGIDIDTSGCHPYTLEALDDYLTVVALFSNKRFAEAIAGGSGHPGFREHVIGFFEKRAALRYEKYADFYQGIDRDLAFACHFGSVVNVLLKVITGRLDRSPESAGLFLARWKLQARGIDPETTAAIMEELRFMIRKIESLSPPPSQ